MPTAKGDRRGSESALDGLFRNEEVSAARIEAAGPYCPHPFRQHPILIRIDLRSIQHDGLVLHRANSSAADPRALHKNHDASVVDVEVVGRR
jgi:hypothetical protein